VREAWVFIAAVRRHPFMRTRDNMIIRCMFGLNVSRIIVRGETV
jgi:hypothetical protein